MGMFHGLFAAGVPPLPPLSPLAGGGWVEKRTGSGGNFQLWNGRFSQAVPAERKRKRCGDKNDKKGQGNTGETVKIFL